MVVLGVSLFDICLSWHFLRKVEELKGYYDRQERFAKMLEKFERKDV